MEDSKKFSLVNIISGVVELFVVFHLEVVILFVYIMDPIWDLVEKVTGKDKEYERKNMFVCCLFGLGLIWYIFEKISHLKDIVFRKRKKKK